MRHPLLRHIRATGLLFGLAILDALVPIRIAHAEPYLAIRTGQRCMVCHVNPAGGGKRTYFGNVYGQTSLPAGQATELLTSEISEHLKIGMDFRGSASADVIENDNNEFAFATERASVYLEAPVVKDRLTLYIDERLAPGASNREAWLMLRGKRPGAFLMAGSFYLPYGLRLEDDTAFIREVTGVSFNNADNGVMLGFDRGPWSLRTSVTNGTNGGAESNVGKQLVARAAYIRPAWRAGASANLNPGADGVSRDMWNVFGGFRLFGMDWLAEADWITDDSPATGERRQTLGLLEANREVKKGHNLKGTFEWLDPDTDVAENRRTRTSLVWEYTPMPMLQLRAGARFRVGIPQNAEQNIDSVFAQLHLWYH